MMLGASIELRRRPCHALGRLGQFAITLPEGVRLACEPRGQVTPRRNESETRVVARVLKLRGGLSRAEGSIQQQVLALFASTALDLRAQQIHGSLNRRVFADHGVVAAPFGRLLGILNWFLVEKAASGRHVRDTPDASSVLSPCS